MKLTSQFALASTLVASPLFADVDMTHATYPYTQGHMDYKPVIVEQSSQPLAKQSKMIQVVSPRKADAGRTREDDVEIEYNDDDPIEGFNRVIFEINDFFYGLLFTPLAKIYRGVFPDEVRTRVHYVLRNLWEPVNFGNSLLQGDFEQAGTAIGRLVTNSTLGVAGIFDVGTDWGMPYERRDFGMTLASWGVGDGGYFVIPLIGPSTFRDFPSIAVDIVMDPLTWILPHTDVYYLSYVRSGMEALDEYAEVMPDVEDLRETSIDFYASIRSWHLERRRARVREALGLPPLMQDAPTPDDEV